MLKLVKIVLTDGQLSPDLWCFNSEGRLLEQRVGSKKRNVTIQEGVILYTDVDRADRDEKNGDQQHSALATILGENGCGGLKYKYVLHL